MKPFQLIFAYARKYTVSLIVTAFSMLALVAIQLLIPWIVKLLVARVTTPGATITSMNYVTLLAVIVLAIKFTIRRRRPEGEWGAFYRSTDPHSFPSGHAARVVLIAVLALGLGPWWLALVLCIWAPLVALARVAMGVHYLSDVVAGALVGAVAGLIALQIVH